MLNRSTPPRFTYGDYRRWHGDERWELIDGTAFAMSPAPSRRHQQIVGRLFSRIAAFLADHDCEAYVAPFDVRLPATGEEPDDAIETVVQPDISVICDATKLDDAGCRGAPDWIIEVSSPHTGARDEVQKRDLYERHGVGEYWIVHPYDALVTIYRRASGARFAEPVVVEARAGEAARPELFPALGIDWERVFAD